MPFHHERDLLGNNTTTLPLLLPMPNSSNPAVTPSLEDDIHRLQQSSQYPAEDDTQVS